VLSENTLVNPELMQLDISVRRIIGRALLKDCQILFQEYNKNGVSSEEKLPLRIYIVNHGANIFGNEGSPVKSVKLCKVLLDPEFPQNTIVALEKSKILIKYQIVLIAEFEDGSFDVISLPKDLSSIGAYNEKTVKAFVENPVIDMKGVPLIQCNKGEKAYDTFLIESKNNAYTSFEYSTCIPLSSFSPSPEGFQLEDPTLRSSITLRNLRYEIDVGSTCKILIGNSNNNSIWTTIIDFSLYEDINNKMSIEQDIYVPGMPVEE
jgi:hypothetical protein